MKIFGVYALHWFYLGLLLIGLILIASAAPTYGCAAGLMCP